MPHLLASLNNANINTIGTIHTKISHDKPLNGFTVVADRHILEKFYYAAKQRLVPVGAS